MGLRGGSLLEHQELLPNVWAPANEGSAGMGGNDRNWDWRSRQRASRRWCWREGRGEAHRLGSGGGARSWVFFSETRQWSSGCWRMCIHRRVRRARVGEFTERFVVGADG